MSNHFAPFPPARPLLRCLQQHKLWNEMNLSPQDRHMELCNIELSNAQAGLLLHEEELFAF